MQKLIVILNKIDIIEEGIRDAQIHKRKEGLKKIFSKTKFTDQVPMVPISAMIGANDSENKSLNMDLLISTVLE